MEQRSGGQPFRLGRYRLDKLIGQGGMAEVYLAHGEAPGSRAVVKRIRPSLLNNAASKKHVEMFLREAALLASLDHENIVRIFELGIEPPRNGKTIGEHFIAMEHLEGLTLRDLALRSWQAQQPLSVEVLLRVVADLCVGLDHAHRMKDPATGKGAALVHRDISPDNIFVTSGGVTKLLDFGVAKREGWAGLTSAGELKGKVPFMAPEQLKEEPVDARTDVFAIGVVLYWLLTGQRPFDGPSEIFVMKAILDDAPRPLRDLNPKVPPDVESAVLLCLEKDRGRRMASAESLRDALLAALPSSAPVPVAAVITAAMALPPAERELLPAVAAASTTSWQRWGGPGAAGDGEGGFGEPTLGAERRAVVVAPADLDHEQTADIEFTMPGVAPASEPPSLPIARPPTAPFKAAAADDAAARRLKSVPALPLELHPELARLRAEIMRLEGQLAAPEQRAVDNSALVAAVSPLLWGLEQAVVYFASLPGEPTLTNHLRQLQILHGVLKRIVDVTNKR